MLAVILLSNTVTAYAADRGVEPDQVVAEAQEETDTTSYEEEIPFDIEYVYDETQFEEYRAVTRQGVPGILRITVQKQKPGVIQVAEPEVKEKVIKKPVSEIVVVGTRESEVSQPLDTGDFIHPLDEEGYISNGYGGSYHKGVDLAAPAGTPIYATAAGRVSVVKYGNTGYGYYLKIDHGNGVETLYAHNSEILVKEGDWVEQGDEIAKVGCTGRSSGNHLQYEIRVDGNAVNPTSYIA